MALFMTILDWNHDDKAMEVGVPSTIFSGKPVLFGYMLFNPQENIRFSINIY